MAWMDGRLPLTPEMEVKAREQISRAWVVVELAQSVQDLAQLRQRH